MHELSIAQALIEQVEEAAVREGATGVASVTVVVGGLSGVDPDALELAFPMAAEDTLAAGAKLLIEQVPSRLVCRACGATCSPDLPMMVCESCGSSDTEITAGRELLLKALELRVPEE